MNFLGQIGALLAIGLASIPRRPGSSLLIVTSIAGTVAVLIFVLAMEWGFAEMAAKSGRNDRLIVLRAGADTEASSRLSRDDVAAILGVRSIRSNQTEGAIASADAIAFVRLADKRTGLDTFAPVRGVGNKFLSLRPEIDLVQGRMFRSGLRELVVGKSLQRRLGGLDVGRRLSLPQGDWTIVGVFASDGDSHESELLADAETLLSAYNRHTFNSVTVLLEMAEDFHTFNRALVANPALSVQVQRERDYVSAVSEPTTRLLRVIASFVGGLMALGAMLAAVNAMYSAISARSVEIATLRAIGYGAVPVVIAVVIETLICALLGAAIGAAVAWLYLNGGAVSTLASSSPAPVTYVLHVSPEVVALCVECACFIGLIGSVFPAVRIARASIVAGLRGA